MMATLAFGGVIASALPAASTTAAELASPDDEIDLTPRTPLNKAPAAEQTAIRNLLERSRGHDGSSRSSDFSDSTAQTLPRW